MARKGHPLQGKSITVLDLKKFPCIFEDTNLNAYIAAVYGKEYCMSDTLVLETQTGIRRYLDSTDAISVMPQYDTSCIAGMPAVEPESLPPVNCSH